MALNFNPSFSGSIIDFNALRDYNDKKRAERDAKQAQQRKESEERANKAVEDIQNYLGQQNRIKDGKAFDAKFAEMTPEEQAKYGWISSPEYTEARSVYERTGDPTALNNLRSTWQAQQNADRQFKLQQDQIDAQKEEANAAKIAAQVEKDRLAKLSTKKAMNKITYASKITDSDNANQLIMNAKDVADDLRSDGYTDLADEIESKIPDIQAAGVEGDNSAIDRQIANLRRQISPLPDEPEYNVRASKDDKDKAKEKWKKDCDAIKKANAEIKKKIKELEAQRK